MNSVQIEENVKNLVKQVSSQEISKDDFVYELLLAYGHRKSVVSRVKSGERNLAKTAGEVILKRHLYFKPCTSNLFAEIDTLKNSKTVATNKIRFVVVTDFSQLIAIDTKTQDALDIELGQLAKHFDFFLPWAGMEKMVYRGENPADVKAAEKMADFFDHIKATNYPVNATKEQLHEMVVFLNRLLFCFFAEDTKIFSENQFTNLMNQHTQEDGSDLVGVFERLFDVLNTPAHQRNDLPKYLNDFPYVNGGLFKKQIKVPTFDAKARRMLLDSGTLDWSDINPDIFGSMIQGVADPETRSKMGMHYTSVSNIMKVIEPLFLNDLYEEFDKCNDNINKLKKLQVRLSRIKFFDPACGSGNFLIITYKEIRELEIEILKRIRELEGESDSGMMGLFDESHSAIRLDQFYGIELDDFAHEMAILSLWLVEHQMNMVFETEFGYTAPTLPLKQSGRIVAGNATRIDWDLICPAYELDEVFIVGNPPYVGYSDRDKDQKADMDFVFGKDKNVKRLDFIGCWFNLASEYIKEKNASFAFVSTKSICQGEQTSLLWPLIFNRKQEIFFAHLPFDWVNNAKGNAGVTCIIVGVRNKLNKGKVIFSNNSVSSVRNINAYLIDAPSIILSQTKSSICGLPEMALGSSGIDGGHLILSKEEKEQFIENDSRAKKFIKPFIGGADFLRGTERYCLWIDDQDVEEAKCVLDISDRIQKCQEWRETGGRDAKKAASVPHRFFYRKYQNEDSIVLPMTSSGKRKYLPLGFMSSGVIASNGVFVVYGADLTLFAILSSRLHSVWMEVTSARMRNDFRYSVNLTYNTFPLPQLNERERSELEECAAEILEVRELYPDKNLSQLYNPDTMPEDLLIAHDKLDRTLEKKFSITIRSDEERQKALFAAYNLMQENKNA
ncbi:TPA: class I SAM-dependent DNA methyltransferase [Vibrio parahaemolyticus]|nr:class I SAM-dependent DNA methyltransferase [Vibrio parahaemolyticus]